MMMMVRRFFAEDEIRRTWAAIRILHAVAGALLGVIGYAYSPISPSPETFPAGLEILTEDVPMWVWGVPWLVAGGLVVTSSVLDLRPPWLARAAGYTVAICLAWALAYAAGWLAVGGRGWVSAAIYGLVAVLYVALAESVKLLRPVVKAASE